jgi:hypothetical protein
MGKLKNNYETFERPGLVVSYRMATCEIFKGALVGLDARGYAVPMQPIGTRFLGVANQRTKNEEAEGSKFTSVVKSGSFVYPSEDEPTQMMIGNLVFAAEDGLVVVQTMDEIHSETFEGMLPIGRVIELARTSDNKPGIRVRIDGFTV